MGRVDTFGAADRNLGFSSIFTRDNQGCWSLQARLLKGYQWHLSPCPCPRPEPWKPRGGMMRAAVGTHMGGERQGAPYGPFHSLQQSQISEWLLKANSPPDLSVHTELSCFPCWVEAGPSLFREGVIACVCSCWQLPTSLSFLWVCEFYSWVVFPASTPDFFSLSLYFLAVLGVRCCVGFSLVGEGGGFLAAERGL